MRFDPKKRTVPLTDVELNYSPEEWAEALAEDPSCVRAYLKAAEERGRRRGVEELTDARALLVEIRHELLRDDGGHGSIAELPANLRRASTVARLSAAIRALDAAIAPRDSAPARYCDEPHPDRPLRCGRFVKHDGPHTAFVPGFEDEQRAAVHWEDRK